VSAVRDWLLKGTSRRPGAHEGKPWWRVMCLTGVAVLAAGIISPLATLVLVLLGFAATDFMITITLSAVDASAHMLENPIAADFLHGQRVLVTLLLIVLLGAVFLMGFTEAIGIAVGLVGVYLVLNAVVVVVGLGRVVTASHLVPDCTNLVLAEHGNWWAAVAIALIVFPRLALGLSGFETGVSVMPLVRGDPDDDPDRPAARIRNTRKLLTTAALIMSGFLERPEGLRIGSFFIGAIIVTSLISRATRSVELRVTGFELDELAERFLREYPGREIHVIANEPDARDKREYRDKEREQRENHHLPADLPALFLEVTVPDSSEFEDVLRVEGEANPLVQLLGYLLTGEGDVPPLTREVLRRVEQDPRHRPVVHVG
jgi:hypothetical protein